MNPEQEREWAVQRRACLIQELLRLTRARGVEWLREYVRGCKWWDGIREEFWREWRK